jgi:hypothetical protein
MSGLQEALSPPDQAKSAYRAAVRDRQKKYENAHPPHETVVYQDPHFTITHTKFGDAPHVLDLMANPPWAGESLRQTDLDTLAEFDFAGVLAKELLENPIEPGPNALAAAAYCKTAPLIEHLADFIPGFLKHNTERNFLFSTIKRRLNTSRHRGRESKRNDEIQSSDFIHPRMVMHENPQAERHIEFTDLIADRGVDHVDEHNRTVSGVFDFVSSVGDDVACAKLIAGKFKQIWDKDYGWQKDISASHMHQFVLDLNNGMFQLYQRIAQLDPGSTPLKGLFTGIIEVRLPNDQTIVVRFGDCAYEHAFIDQGQINALVLQPNNTGYFDGMRIAETKLSHRVAGLQKGDHLAFFDRKINTPDGSGVGLAGHDFFDKEAFARYLEVYTITPKQSRPVTSIMHTDGFSTMADILGIHPFALGLYLRQNARTEKEDKSYFSHINTLSKLFEHRLKKIILQNKPGGESISHEDEQRIRNTLNLLQALYVPFFQLIFKTAYCVTVQGMPETVADRGKVDDMWAKIHSYGQQIRLPQYHQQNLIAVLENHEWLRYEAQLMLDAIKNIIGVSS